LIPSIISQSFADSILVEFDKLEYYTGDSITISGQILDFKMPVIALSIYDPDGKIISANNVEINSDGIFSKIFTLDSPFYDKSGEYKVKLNYGKITQNEFFTMLGKNFDSEIILTQPINPEIIFLSTDQIEYTDNDIITITGFVSGMGQPSVLVGIYDPFGTPTGFYTEQINSNFEFSRSFLVKSGVNFKTDGTYSIKVHYGESEKTTTFNFYKQIPLFSDNDLIGNDSIENPIDGITKSDPIDTTTISKSDPPITKDNSIILNSDDSFLAENNPKENTKTKSSETNMQNRKHDNLSVEDIELGKLLNQINLECDNNKFTDIISYYDGMGPALYRLCKFEQSLIFFDDSLIKDPNNFEVLTNKGSTLGKLGRFSESIIYYDKALEINPDFIPAINNKANALANMGKYDQSVSLYMDAIEKNPDFQTARKNLTLVLSEMSSENTILPTAQESLSKEIPSKNVFQTQQSSKLQTEQSSNFFEEIGVVFSSLGSLFGFLN
jgi:tetratricopeptide (TPR) repeat protein